ncbi:MAG: hypothetical protein QXH89_02780, partial [Candidatus Anstonellales archaeon]
MHLLILGLLIVLSSAEWDVLVMWNRTFHGGYGGDQGYSITKSDDGGYVIVGWSWRNNGANVWVIKIDANGNHVWNRTFHGGYGGDRGSSIVKSDDGGYVIVGGSYQGTTNRDGVWVIKIDANGNHVWNRTFHGGYGSDVGHSVIKSDDGGYVIVGWSYQGTTNGADIWVIKIDANGNHVWNRTFHGGYGWDYGSSII